MAEPSNAAQNEKKNVYQQPHDDSNAPRDLKVKIKEQLLLIDWKDGSQSNFPMDTLRKVCPCAQCKTERTQQSDNPLNILKFDPAGVRVMSANLVGNYAIQLHWSDGHNTGIFDFRFLKELDQS